MNPKLVLPVPLTSIVRQDSRIDQYRGLGRPVMPVFYTEVDPWVHRPKNEELLYCYLMLCEENENHSQRVHYVLFLPLLCEERDGKVVVPDVQRASLISKPLGSNRLHIRRLMASLAYHAVGADEFHSFVEKHAAEWPEFR